MKKLVLSFALIFFASLASVAQMEEGKVTYKITYDSDDENMKAQLAMMGTGTKETIFKGDWTKDVMDQGGMSKSVSIMNSKTKQGLLLIDVPMMGAKYAVVIDEESWEDAKGKNEMADDTEVEETGNTEEIAGYKTKEVLVTDPDGNEVLMYVTDQIAPGQYGEKTKKIGGFPLKTEMENQSMIIVMEATEVSDEKVDDSEFSLDVPEGYEEKTMEELKQLGMGG